MTSGRVPARFETPIRIRFDEAGADRLVRSSTFLRWFQDVAWMHSEGAGFGRDWYATRSLTWLIRATKLEIPGTVEYGASVLVSTEVIGFRRVWARRVNEVRRVGDTTAIARATIDWVLLGPAGLPTRVPPEILEAFRSTLPAFTPLRVSLPPTPRNAAAHEFTVSRRDLDPMAHMNNAAYVDYLEEALESGGAADVLEAVPRRYALEYALPAPPGMRAVGSFWPIDDGWAYRLTTTAGTELFRARATPGQSPEAR